MDIKTNLDVTQCYFLGFKEKEGDYEITDEKTGKTNKGHYHNFVISLAEPYNGDEKQINGHIGLECNERTCYKVKSDMIGSVFGVPQTAFNPVDFVSWIFKPVSVSYDKRGNLKSIRLIETK